MLTRSKIHMLGLVMIVLKEVAVLRASTQPACMNQLGFVRCKYPVKVGQNGAKENQKFDVE